jgi:hypothetical protein
MSSGNGLYVLQAQNMLLELCFLIELLQLSSSNKIEKVQQFKYLCDWFAVAVAYIINAKLYVTFVAYAVSYHLIMLNFFLILLQISTTYSAWRCSRAIDEQEGWTPLFSLHLIIKYKSSYLFNAMSGLNVDLLCQFFHLAALRQFHISLKP